MVNKLIGKVIFYCSFITVFSIAITACHSTSIERYDGDGVITANASFMPNGFTVNLDEFDLRYNYKEIKMLQNYPQIEKNYVFGIYVESVNGKLDRDLNFYLSMKIVTSKGDTLFNCEGYADSWSWGHSAILGKNKEHIRRYFIYYMNTEQESIFHLNDVPRDNSTLYLHVNYIPSESLTSSNEVLTGSIQLQVGGYK
jgi:hypothetical protein